MLTCTRPIHHPPVRIALPQNITRYYIFSLLRGASLGTPIVLWVVFLQQHYGFSMTEVVLLDLPFWVGKFLFEIPTGVVADKFGRRVSLAISAVMSSLIWMVFALSGSFWVLAMAQFVGALAATFQSGADEALLFESLQAAGREQDYARISARAGAVGTLSSMLAGLVVGLIAATNLVLPVVLTSLLTALTLIPILGMKETVGTAGALPVGTAGALPADKGPAAPASEGPPAAAQDSYLSIVHQAFAALREQAILRWAAAYLVLLGCVSFYAVTFLQPYTLEVGLPLAALGPVMVAVQGMSVAGALAVPLALRILGSRVLLFGVPLLLVPGLVLIGLAPGWPVLVVAALLSFLFSLTQPVLLAVLQSRASNQARATLLSIQSLLSTVFLTFTEPPLGISADRFGVASAYLWMAGLVAIFLVSLLLRGRRSLDLM